MVTIILEVTDIFLVDLTFFFKWCRDSSDLVSFGFLKLIYYFKLTYLF